MKITPRDLILGGQDGLVNVVGIILGLSAAAASERTIIIASLAAGFAEAISMGAVAYTSAKADKIRIEREGEKEFLGDSFIVGFSALIGSIIPLVPFFFLPTANAVILSLALSAVALFTLGASAGKSLGHSKFKSGTEILFIGFIAAFAGFVIGLMLK
jgi:VIT1/CCC1 family predicted Fe2+/Mn2+ transporter